MYFLILAALGIAGLLGYEAVAKAQTKPVLPTGGGAATPPAAAPPSRTPKFVAPFAVGAPRATYALNSANSGGTFGLRVGETMTVDLPQKPMSGVMWWSSVMDDQSGTNRDQSAVYPFGDMMPGNTPDTQAFGFVAIRPGHTKITLSLIGAMQDPATATPQAQFQVDVNVSA